MYVRVYIDFVLEVFIMKKKDIHYTGLSKVK